jgi:hypothetical protein
MKLDPGMHIGLHLVFFGKTGVTGRGLWNFVLGISFGKKSSIYLRTPKRFATIAPISCLWLKRLQRRSFRKMWHTSPWSSILAKNPRIPSPRVEQEPGHEEEIFEEGAAQPDQPHTGAQTVTGLTGGEAGSMAGLAGPRPLHENFSTSYLGCVGASMT